jgi:alpha-glucoside transport system permease protein
MRSRILPWIYVAPALLLLTLFLVLPTLRTIVLSFLDGRSRQWVGWDNYRYLFTNPDMLIACRNNLLWFALVTGLSVSLGLGLAVLVDRVRYESFAKSLIFLPMAISFVGASVIWRFVYAYQPPNDPQIGLLNALLTHFGSNPVGWLIYPPLNTLALIVIMIWLQTGFAMVLLSAAIKAIPADIVEAARMDGATEWQIFWRVTLPLVRPTLVVVATTITVVVLKIFDIVYVMTGGNLKTDVIATRLIKEMFTYRHYGRGSAIAVLLLIVVFPILVANVRRFHHQEGHS